MRFIHNKDMDAFIRENYMLVAPELAKQFNQRFGTDRTATAGTELIKGDGYWWVKTAEPNVWKQKSRLIWEAEHGRSLIDDEVLWYIDGDITNCVLSNLELGTRSEHVRRNKLQLSSQPEELKPTIKLLAKLQDRAGKAKRGEVL